MKTIPDLEDIEDMYEDRYNTILMPNWERPEGDKFGTWYDWSEEDVHYLIRELINGHYDDTGDKCIGFLSVSEFMHIAEINNQTDDAPKLECIFYHLLNALHFGSTQYENENPANTAKVKRIIAILNEEVEPSVYDEMRPCGTTLH